MYKVTLEPIELEALLELAALAGNRLSTAEAITYNTILTRMKNELAAQVQADAQQADTPAQTIEHTEQLPAAELDTLPPRYTAEPV